MVYNCTIEKDGDVYIAQFPDIPYVQTCGFSQEEALAMAKEVLDISLEEDIARENNIPPPSFNEGYPVAVASHIALCIRLRELRADKSQTEIANRLGLSYQAYQRLENPRKANPTVKTLEKIARVYGRQLRISI